MKNLSKKFILLFPAAFILVAYFLMPKEVSVTKGQKINFNFAMSTECSTDKIGEFSSTIKLFNLIPIKTVNVSVTPEYYVIPSGETIGIKMHTDGVLVLGSGNVTDKSGKVFSPAKDAGLKKGDRITQVNGITVYDNYDLKTQINKAKENIILTIVRDDEILEIPISAVYSRDSGIYQIGIWIRDSAAGIGTLTFYDPNTKSFAALGHGICDVDTDTLLKARDGCVNFCDFISVKKSVNGEPGEITGNFSGEELGDLTLNSDVGIYGKCSKIPTDEAVFVASRFETEKGPATLTCDIDGNGPKSYKIEITKIFNSPSSPNKSFVFKITDDTLVEKTGGIVQGMSGSPIIQNGKLIGAVTHVFVNDSKKGYGIFAENMLDITNKMK